MKHKLVYKIFEQKESHLVLPEDESNYAEYETIEDALKRTDRLDEKTYIILPVAVWDWDLNKL